MAGNHKILCYVTVITLFVLDLSCSIFSLFLRTATVDCSSANRKPGYCDMCHHQQLVRPLLQLPHMCVAREIRLRRYIRLFVGWQEVVLERGRQTISVIGHEVILVRTWQKFEKSTAFVSILVRQHLVALIQ